MPGYHLRRFIMKKYLSKLVKGQDLTRTEARECMDLMLSGEATPIQAAGFLTALRIKGESIDEILGCAEIMQGKGESISPNVENYIDFVGTGGDGTNTFNISTTSCIVAAAAGVAVAKHGNRASSSRSGSTDCLEKLGVNIALTPDKVQKCVENVNIGYMNAQIFHKLMKNVAAVRKELGIRTIFNILGPLSNPSRSKRQLIGVFDRDIIHTYASAMQILGVERALVVCGSDGMDEITATGITYVSEISDGKIKDYTIDPKDYGFEYAVIEDLKGADPEDNAAITRNILSGTEKGKKLDIVLINAGAAIYIGGGAASIAEGIEKARETIQSGKAIAKLDEFVKFTNEI